ncbi:two-component system OmpR family sensor kinase [Paraburkholderia atlantica]|uniref:histidine kinase n=1 Tax=Paraburkholderia youngii TaxID=2782701 RepID=A0ABX2NW14_9BURK|nr:ATP-binding protein [Paraburkholderia youngii]NVI08690.1 two-component sensor histidine kinase [Paraburkholderia youngii]
MSSLKNQITVTLIVLVTAVGLIDAYTSYWLSRKHIGELLDVHLQGAAIWLSAGNVGAIGSHGPPQHSVDGFVGQIWRSGDAAPTDNTDPELLFDRNAPDGYSIESIGGHAYRIYTLRKADGQYTYQVGQPVAFREETARHAALESLIPTLILIPLVWLAIPFVVNAAFASLSRAAAQSELVGIRHLEPLDISGVPDEVRPFAASVNRMIARLQVGIDAEKRFVADAAHELRTPIAAMQLRVDNLVNAPDEAARSERLRELREAIARASTMIRQLLSLARADAQLDLTAIETVDLSQLVQKLVADFLPVADARSIDLGVGKFESAQVEAREGELRMAVRNLLENALRYTPAGGTVDIDLFRSADDLVVRVTDNGPGIPEASLDRVFDRFFRLRAEDSEGSGLGLSIVKSVVAKYRGSISLANRSDGHSGLIATIVLPARGTM